ncbi:hypothetical protein KFK09_013580 [Dendrobium nobile]|uniref:Uncharacterized protein n=1 Tax=Dendrobium nobile TaxID=94219 RepID=A0A8T3B995_DENNO|nr:hypothetical protein KFK09_013580 [Dendrobium nobile]
MRFASDDCTRAFQRTTNWTVTSPTGRSVANIPERFSSSRRTKLVAKLILKESLLLHFR